MAKKPNDFSGIWHCAYWYPSNQFVGDAISEYDMKVIQDGDQLIFESLPNKIKAYMFIRLNIVDNVAIGTWHESTSPTGEFKGANYSGAGQLIIDPEKQYMEGRWAGAGFDQKLKKMRIYSGAWELKRVRDDKAKDS